MVDASRASSAALDQGVAVSPRPHPLVILKPLQRNLLLPTEPGTTANRTSTAYLCSPTISASRVISDAIEREVLRLMSAGRYFP